MSHPSSNTDAPKQHSSDNISDTQENELPEEKSNVDASGEDASQYITGVKLYTVIAGLTMVAFLMMLDSTVVTTVC